MRVSQHLIPKLLLILLIQPALAASEEFSEHPGYVDFSALHALTGQQPSTEINLSGGVLKWVRSLQRKQGQGKNFSALDLERINFNRFKTDEAEFEQISAAMRVIADRLTDTEWQHLLRIYDEDSYLDIFFLLSEDGQTLYGSTILAAEPGETSFVNYAGDIAVEGLKLRDIMFLMRPDWISGSSD